MIELTDTAIDYQTLMEAVRSVRSGAIVLFLGTVRDMSEGKPVSRLFYEVHEPMAKKELERIVALARSKWPLDDCRVAHRHGQLELGDIAVAVVTAAGHRAEAFEAARWVMDEIKKTVPIWKQESFVDSGAVWVHPS